jgi:ribonuclease HI
MADLVTQYCGLEIAVIKPIPWTIFFDRSSCGVGAGIVNVLISAREESYEFSIPIEKTSKNTQVEYQAVLKGVIMKSSSNYSKVQDGET